MYMHNAIAGWEFIERAGGGGAKGQGMGAALGPGQSPGWAKPINRFFNKEQYTKTIYKPIK